MQNQVPTDKLHILQGYLYIITFIWPQMVSELFQKVQDSYVQQTELGWKRRGQRQQSTTAASHFLQSLTELTTRLERYQQRKLADTEHHYQICGFVWKPAQYHQKGYFFTACVVNTVLANEFHSQCCLHLLLTLCLNASKSHC